MSSAGFWSLKVEPGKTYKSTTDHEIRVTMAALPAEIKDKSRSSLILSVDDEEVTVCSLTPEKIEQQPLDLLLTEGETICFQIVGKNAIDLCGYYPMPSELPDLDEMEEDEEEMEGESEEEEEDVEDEEELKAAEAAMAETDEDSEGDDQEISEEEDDEEISEEEEEEEKPVAKPVNNKRPAEQKKEAPAVKQQKTEQPKKEQPKKEQPKKEEPAPKKEEPKTTVKELPSGLVIEEKVRGEGARAKNGKRIFVRYVGKLRSNGKKFDENTSGKPFSFVLGRGEVIKGWDLGFQGMQVGGVRRMIIPAKLAYGSQGAPPDIPRNADLVFDVKLLDVK